MVIPGRERTVESQTSDANLDLPPGHGASRIVWMDFMLAAVSVLLLSLAVSLGQSSRYKLHKRYKCRHHATHSCRQRYLLFSD